MTAAELADLEKRLREEELTAARDYREGKADAPVLYRAAGRVKAAATEGGLTEFVASEESEDRYGDVILADGWDLKSYKRNPVFLWAHSHDVPPIGSVPRVQVEGKQLLATVRWDDDDPLAAAIHGKFARGFMHAVSVGFRAMEIEERETKEATPFGMGGLLFKKVDLLEISAVPVPAHPKALKKAMEGARFGIVMPDLAALFALGMARDAAPAGERRAMDPKMKRRMGKMRDMAHQMADEMDAMMADMDEMDDEDMSGKAALPKDPNPAPTPPAAERGVSDDDAERLRAAIRDLTGKE